MTFIVTQVSYYRFSISWARVLPNGIGQVNQAGVDYYKRLIAALKAANIEPMVRWQDFKLEFFLSSIHSFLNFVSVKKKQVTLYHW